MIRTALSPESTVPPKNGLEPLQKFEPLNSVIFNMSTKVFLNYVSMTCIGKGDIFLAMYSIYLLRVQKSVYSIIALEVRGIDILHLPK
jgi:hypothetical protein